MSSKQREALISQAESWLGYCEKKKGTYTDAQLRDKTHAAGYDNYTIFGKWYGLQGQPWCAMGISMCAHDAGLPEEIFPKFADCDAGMAWFKRNKRFHSSPERGDVVFFGVPGDAQHVEIVTEVTATQVKTIGFNTSGGSTMVANGGGVYAKTYSLSYNRILGYGRPDYKEDKVELPELKRLFDLLRAEWRDNDSSVYSEEARKWAVDSGLIGGSGNGADGTPNFMWEDLMTREQFVTVLYRFAQMMGKA